LTAKTYSNGSSL